MASDRPTECSGVAHELNNPLHLDHAATLESWLL
jgi:hypothetical protein